MSSDSSVKERPMKKCYQCKITKSLDSFGSHANRKDGKQTHCKDCMKAHQTKWYYKRKFGITIEERDEMLKEQGGKCAICQNDTEFSPVGSGRTNNVTYYAVVDHCHSSGKIRGILCGGCNTGLGSFKDNPTSLTSAVSYLTK